MNSSVQLRHKYGFYTISILVFLIGLIGCQGEPGKDDYVPPRKLGPSSEYTGNFFFRETDLETSGSLASRPTLRRAYNSRSGKTGLFGLNWIADPVDVSIKKRSGQELLLITPDGADELMRSDNGTDYFAAPNVKNQLHKIIVRTDGSYVAQRHDGGLWEFNRQGYLVSKRDPFGNILTVKRAEDGIRPLYIEGPLGKRIIFHFEGDRIVVADSPGIPGITYKYNASGKLVSVEAGGGQVASYGYNENGLIDAVQQTGNPKVSLAYENGLLSGATIAGIDSYTFHYRPLGDAPNKNFTFESQTASGRKLLRIEERDNGVEKVLGDGRGNRVLLRYDKFGRLVSSKEGTGLEETWSYSETGSLQYHVDPSGNRTSYHRDPATRSLSITGSRGSKEIRYFDEKGVISRIVDQWGNTNEFIRDSRGRIIEVRLNGLSVRKLAYDADGDLAKLTRPDGTYTFHRDPATRTARIKDSAGNETLLETDLQGRLISQTDAEGRKTSWKYAVNGKIASLVDGASGHVEFLYTDGGLLNAISDGNHHSYKFDYKRGVRTRLTFPNSTTETIQLDEAGDIARVVDQSGNEVRYQRDHLGRVILQSTGKHSTSWKYNELGQLIAVSNENASYRIKYNRFGDVWSIRDGKGRSIRYRYNKLGQRTRMIDAEDRETLYRYNAGGRLKQITGPFGEQYDYEYDEVGRIAARRYPNGLTTEYTYDSRGMLAAVSTKNSDGTVRDYTHLRQDKTGMIVRSEGSDGKYIYRYDKAGRLIDVTNHEGRNESFAYDHAGNRLTHMRRDSRLSYQYGSLNELQSDGNLEYLYNEKGELSHRSDGTKYQFNALGQLVQVETRNGHHVGYKYDPFGRLIARVIDGKQSDYVYDKEDIIAIYEQGSASPRTRFVHGFGIDDPLSIREEGKLYTYGLGVSNDVRNLYNDQGDVVTKYAFEPFGEPRNTVPGTRLRHLFHAQLWDNVTSLYYVRARFYDPRLGRFISPDPIRFVGGWNLYAYADNDPINGHDPLGLRGQPSLMQFPSAHHPPVPNRSVTIDQPSPAGSDWLGRVLGETPLGWIAGRNRLGFDVSVGVSSGVSVTTGGGGGVGLNAQYFGPGDPRNDTYFTPGLSAGGGVGGPGPSVNIAIGAPGAAWRGYFGSLNLGPVRWFVGLNNWGPVPIPPIPFIPSTYPQWGGIELATTDLQISADLTWYEPLTCWFVNCPEPEPTPAERQPEPIPPAPLPEQTPEPIPDLAPEPAPQPEPVPEQPPEQPVEPTPPPVPQPEQPPEEPPEQPPEPTPPPVPLPEQPPEVPPELPPELTPPPVPVPEQPPEEPPEPTPPPVPLPEQPPEEPLEQPPEPTPLPVPLPQQPPAGTSGDTSRGNGCDPTDPQGGCYDPTADSSGIPEVSEEQIRQAGAAGEAAAEQGAGGTGSDGGTGAATPAPIDCTYTGTCPEPAETATTGSTQGWADEPPEQPGGWEGIGGGFGIPRPGGTATTPVQGPQTESCRPPCHIRPGTNECHCPGTGDQESPKTSTGATGGINDKTPAPPAPKPAPPVPKPAPPAPKPAPPPAPKPAPSTSGTECQRPDGTWKDTEWCQKLKQLKEHRGRIR